MRPLNHMRTTGLLLAMALGAGCGVGVISDEDPQLNAIRQAAVETINGMVSINGYRSRNGFRSRNGLGIFNGLTSTVDGVVLVNGLATAKGLSVDNGLSVDCTGKTAGVDCTGEPDGVLDSGRGLMATDDGITTAKYLIRCALKSDDSVRIKDYTGGLVSLSGELGLATAWKGALCDSTCQEKISACLMAFTNGKGEHVDIELAGNNVLGPNHSYPYQEASFYGNIFLDPPKAFYCVGDDYFANGRQLETRACIGYNEKDSACPYVRAGECNREQGSFGDDDRCQFSRSSDSARSCEESNARFSSDREWNNPITTFRKDKI